MRVRKVSGRFTTVSVVAAVAVGALLTGCSTGGSPSGSPATTDGDAATSMPFETVTMPSETAPTATPGQRLATGEIALLPKTNPMGDPEDPIETTVIGVAEGDPSYWDDFDNGAEFAGTTPFFAVMQHRWVTGSPSAYTTPLLLPVLDNGAQGGMVQLQYAGSLTSNSACPFEIGRFSGDPERGDGEYIECVVYTAPAGSSVVGLTWQNASPLILSEPDPAENPFYATPVVWNVTPVALP